jgi:hypothetical protein
MAIELPRIKYALLLIYLTLRVLRLVNQELSEKERLNI